jgi:hypothetical protein
MTFGTDELRTEFHLLPLDVQLEIVHLEYGLAVNGLYVHVAQIKPNLILIMTPELNESAPINN